jgi:cytochrome c
MTTIVMTATTVCVALSLRTLTGAARREPGAAAQGPAQKPTVRASVWDGVYTDAQAKRGGEAYQYSCATCHSPDLEGDAGRDVPALYGEEFVGGWSKQSVRALFDLLKKTMPKDSPGSLKAETYADIVAYLLQANEFPSGAGELAADPAALERIAIDNTPPVR